MDLTNIPSFQMFSRSMEYNAQRQNVLAQNIANADTPKYKSLDLAPTDFGKEMKQAEPGLRMQPASSGVSLIAKPAQAHTTYRINEEDNPHEIAPNGNSVVMEDQVFKMRSTNSNYRLAADMYKKQISMISIALGK